MTAPEYTCFEIEKDGPIAHLRLTRDDVRNAMVAEFWSELPAAVRHLDAAGDTRVLVISSTGKHFTSGIDLALLGCGLFPGKDPEPGRKRAYIYQLVQLLQDTFTALTKVRFPVIAAINGACLGGGIDFVTACDLRYCTKDAYFCIQEANVGMVADVGTFPRINHLIPDGLLRELAYTGRPWQADEAHASGFVTRVLDDQDAMLAGVMEVAQSIAEKSPLTVWGTKEVLNHHIQQQTEATLKWIAAWQSGMLQEGELVNAIQAMREKRTPEFDDLLPAPVPLKG
jgi:enoyl-CoA hydratase